MTLFYTRLEIILYICHRLIIPINQLNKKVRSMHELYGMSISWTLYNVSCASELLLYDIIKTDINYWTIEKFIKLGWNNFLFKNKYYY